MTDIFFERPFVTLSFDKEDKLAKAVWQGFLSSGEFREACLKCLELINAEEIQFWIGDNRDMKAIRQADQDWYLDHMIPELSRSSLKKMATLVSDDIFNKMAVESMATKALPLVDFENRFFSSEAAAVSWLLQDRNPGNVLPESESELSEPELTE